MHVFVGKRVYTDRWETFCGSFSWKGKTYNSTTVLNDTLLSLQYGCDSIVRYHYSKIETRYDNRTYTLVQGEELLWFEQRIITDGTYYHTIKSKTNDCDSIVYRLDVTIEAAAPQSPQSTRIESICDGDAIPWRGKTYAPTASQTYVDTVWTDNTKQKIDSIYVLKLTVSPSYKDTFIEHHYVCNGGTAWYHDREITKDSTFDTTFVTIHNCDSIVRVHYHFSDGYRQTDTICLYDFDAPYIWPACPDSSFTAADAGIHTYIKQVPGKCPIEYELVVKPKFMYQNSNSWGLRVQLCLVIGSFKR